MAFFSIPLKPNDPRWVGAWWIGFFMAFVLIVVAVVPVLGFPKRLPCKLHEMSKKNTVLDWGFFN